MSAVNQSPLMGFIIHVTKVTIDTVFRTFIIIIMLQLMKVI